MVEEGFFEKEDRVNHDVVWTEQATGHLYELHDVIGMSRPGAADRQVERIVNAVRSLPNVPLVGRPGRVAGTRELVVVGTRHVVAYRVRPKVIEILAILHGARRWPRSFGE